MSNTYPSGSVHLGDYFVLMRRRWRNILLGILLGVVLTVGYLAFAPRSYTMSTFVLVAGTPGDNATATNSRGPINLDTEAKLVTSTQTLSAVAQSLRLSSDEAASLADHVTVSVPPNTEILGITYVAPTAVGAQRGSLAFAEAYLTQRESAAKAYLDSRSKAMQTQIDALSKQIKPLSDKAATLPAGAEEHTRIEQQISGLNARVTALSNQQTQIAATDIEAGRIVVQPTVPTKPSSPNLLVTLVSGALLSLLLGVGLGVLRQRSDDRIHTPEELFRRTRVPVAAMLSTPLQPGQVTLLPPISEDGRGFARLRNLVTSSLGESDRKVVLVAGIRREVGPVAANLAASVARSGEDVVLVCADVFANTAGALMHTGAHDGLAELLAGETSLAAALQRPAGIKGLRVLGPGRDPDRADALLQTSSPRKLVEELLANASFVVIEAPATAESSDAQTLATVAEMAILVVDAGHTTGREVIDACAQFESMHTPVLGAVFATFGRDREADVADGNAGAEQVPATAQVADRTPGPAASDGVAAVRDQALVPPHLRGRPRP